MQPGHSRRPGHAAQAEQRHPPHIGAQPKPPGDPGIQRRHRNTGDRRRDDQVDVLRCQARLIKRAQQRRTAKIHRFFDENPVCLAEVGQRGIPLQRQDQVATVDLGAGMQLPNYVLVALEIWDVEKRVGELTLGVAIRRQRTEHRCVGKPLLARLRSGEPVAAVAAETGICLSVGRSDVYPTVSHGGFWGWLDRGERLYL